MDTECPFACLKFPSVGLYPYKRTSYSHKFYVYKPIFNIILSSTPLPSVYMERRYEQFVCFWPLPSVDTEKHLGTF